MAICMGERNGTVVSKQALSIYTSSILLYQLHEGFTHYLTESSTVYLFHDADTDRKVVQGLVKPEIVLFEIHQDYLILYLLSTSQQSTM